MVFKVNVIEAVSEQSVALIFCTSWMESTIPDVNAVPRAIDADAEAPPVAVTVAEFMVQLKDSFGSDIDTSDKNNGLEISATIEGVNNGLVYVTPAPEPLGKGLYKVKYTALMAGDFDLHVRLGNRDIYCSESEANKCSPFKLSVTPGRISSLTTEAEISTTAPKNYLAEVIVGELGYFDIQTRDTFGNKLTSGGHNIIVTFTDEDTKKTINGDVTDLNNGRYSVTYQLTDSIKYVMNVDLNDGGSISPITLCSTLSHPSNSLRGYDGFNAYNSPDPCLSHIDNSYNNQLEILVEPAALASESSNLNDKSIDTILKSVVAGEEFTIRIEARDRFNNLRIQSSSDDFKATVVHGTTSSSLSFDSVSSGTPGLYDIKIMTPNSGEHTLTLTGEDGPIVGNPIIFTAVHGDIDASQSILSGAGTTGGKAGEVLVTYLQLVDYNSNKIMIPVDKSDIISKIKLELKHRTFDSIVIDTPNSIQVLPNGQIKIDFIATIVGDYDLLVSYAGAIINSQAVVLNIDPGMEDATTSYHNISRVMTVGTSEYISVNLKDMYDNALNSGLDESNTLTVTAISTAHKCVDVANTNIEATLISRPPYTDGMYVFLFTPEVSGDVEFSVKLSGKHVVGSPFKGFSYPGPVVTSKIDTTGSGYTIVGQLTGCLAVCAFAFAFSFILSLILKVTIGIRVSEEDEVAGLDVSEHGQPAYSQPPVPTAATVSV